MKTKTNLRAGTEATSPPIWLAEVIRAAEDTWHNNLGIVRKLAEDAQDLLAAENPSAAYRNNYSIGNSNIRPQTARAAIDWIFNNQLEQSIGFQERPDDNALVAMILNPAEENKVVLSILTHLQQIHPGLNNMNWDQITASDSLIAKIYSGYLGAGGAWDQWKSGLIPGQEAMSRLQCRENSQYCALIQQFRPT